MDILPPEMVAALGTIATLNDSEFDRLARSWRDTEEFRGLEGVMKCLTSSDRSATSLKLLGWKTSRSSSGPNHEATVSALNYSWRGQERHDVWPWKR